MLNGNINLIVGRNSTGKTTTVRKIIDLTQLIQSGKTESSGVTELYSASFKESKNKSDFKEFFYEVMFSEEGVIKENLSGINNNDIKIPLIIRNEDSCQMYDLTDNILVETNPPSPNLAINLRDTIKHKYLEYLFNWANSVHAYSFSGLAENAMPYYVYDRKFENLGTFMNKFYDVLQKDNTLINTVLKNLQHLNYDINDISFREVKTDKKPLIYSLFKEEGVLLPIPQFLISSGMNRVFHIIAIIEYFLKHNYPLTLVIDDIGEGLDYKRSTILTKLLIEKIKDSKIQLIITSNDRFLMNLVDLQYWNILYRKGSEVKAYNYSNNKEDFDEFLDIGLNNFNYFSDFYEEMENDI